MSRPKKDSVESDLPTIISFSVFKDDKHWKCVKLHTQGDKVVYAEILAEDMRAVAFEKFRIESVREFIEKDHTI